MMENRTVGGSCYGEGMGQGMAVRRKGQGSLWRDGTALCSLCGSGYTNLYHHALCIHTKSMLLRVNLNIRVKNNRVNKKRLA